MKIETKFNIGDEVVSINRTLIRSEKVCPLCKGEKKFVGIHYSDFSIDCPKCAGTGVIGEYGGSQWTVVGRDTIKRIHTSSFSEPKFNVIDYDLDKASGSAYERDLFSSVREAQEECDKRNNEEVGIWHD